MPPPSRDALRITVLGGGHGSYAAAADLTLHGHDVTLWRRNALAFEPLRAQRRIVVHDAFGTHAATLAAIDDELARAVRDAELIVAPVPAFGQPELSAALAPLLAPGQVVLLPPGSFGSYLFARAAAATPGLAFAETGTLPYLTRKATETELKITQRTTRLPTGVFPARRSAAAFDVIRRAYPSIEPVRDALDAALLNAGPIIHTPLMIMNAAPLEHFPAWDIHNEGTQPAVRSVTDALDAERVSIRSALGYGPPHFPLADYYRTDGEEWMYGRDAKARLVESGDWREAIDLRTHRYVREDIACGLAFLVSVAHYAGVAAPVAAGLLRSPRRCSVKTWPRAADDARSARTRGAEPGATRHRARQRFLVIVAAGAGRMGRSIALALALAGDPVAIVDLKERAPADAARLLAEARAEIDGTLAFLVRADVIDDERRAVVAQRMTLHARAVAKDVLAAASVVFEGATETLEAKERIFAQLSEWCPAEAILASTSSTFSADELAHFVTHPERFIITHWLNPAYLIPLVEVSPGSGTAETTTATIRALLAAAGKVTVLCKPSPGFIVPRIQVLAMNEAARIVAEGVATAEDVDTAIRYGFGFRYAVMGLIEFIDLGGVDILYHASNHLRHALGGERFAAPAIVNDHIAAGNLGSKTGSGFYDWSGDGGDARREETLVRVIGLLRHLGLLTPGR